MESPRSNAVLFQALVSLLSCMKRIGFYGYRWIPRKSLSPSDLFLPVLATIVKLLQRSLSPSASLSALAHIRSLFGCYQSTRSLPGDPGMDLPSIKRLIELERDRLKKVKRRKVSPLEVSHWCLTTALCIVASLEGDCTAAADWLASPHRRGKPFEESIDHETTKVELKKLYEAVPPGEVAQWADPLASPLPRSCLTTALQWSHEYKLKHHVRSANVDYGAPVRSVRLIEHYNAKLREDGMETHLPVVPSLESYRGRKWCERWRIRHGAKVGCLRTREPVSLDEKRTQAYVGAGLCGLVVNFYWMVQQMLSSNPSPAYP